MQYEKLEQLNRRKKMDRYEKALKSLWKKKEETTSQMAENISNDVFSTLEKQNYRITAKMFAVAVFDALKKHNYIELGKEPNCEAMRLGYVGYFDINIDSSLLSDLILEKLESSKKFKKGCSVANYVYKVG